jgi:hypothetical protein
MTYGQTLTYDCGDGKNWHLFHAGANGGVQDNWGQAYGCDCPLNGVTDIWCK